MIASPDDPRPSSPPTPTDHLVLVPVLSIITLCLLFILWRRADAMKGAVAYRLKNCTLRGPGRIRLGDEEREGQGDGLDGDLTDDDLSEEEEEEVRSPGGTRGGARLSTRRDPPRRTPSKPILPRPPIPHLHLTPPTPAADPAAIFELGGEEEVDAVELPARVGTEEVVVGIKELEEVAEGEEGAKKGGGGS